MTPTDAVESALGAAAIPPGRRGRARTARLSDRERGFYHWTRRRFANGAEIEIEVTPDGEATRRPDEAVVVCGTSGRGVSSSSCCPVLNFFASSAHAERWLVAHPEVGGTVISMEEAIGAGRAVFGDVLKEE